MRKLFPLLCALALAAGCGGRVVGSGWDGAPPPPDVDDLADRPDWDGWTPPDDVGCWPTPWQVPIYNPGEPTYVHSLDRTAGQRYVLAASQGMAVRRASLHMLDGETLELLSNIGVDADTVHARFDQWSGDVLALAEGDGEVRVQRYFIVASHFLELADSQWLCDDCTAAWSGPETVEAFAGVAVTDHATGRIRTFVYPVDQPGVQLEAPGIDGEAPAVVANGERLSVFYERDEQVWVLDVDLAAQLSVPSPCSPPGESFLIGAESYGSGTRVAAMLSYPPTGPQLSLNLVAGAMSSERIVAPSPLIDPAPGAVSFSPHTVAMAVGVSEGDVGAHFWAASTGAFTPLYGPQRVSAPLGPSAEPTPFYAVTAYHPRGHAVVWSGWHEDGGHGIYGKLVECNAAP